MLYALLFIAIFIAIRQEKLMSQFDDLNVVIDAVATDVTAVAGDVTEVLALLTAAQGTSADLSPAIAKLTAVKTALDNVDSSLKAVEPAAPPVTEPTV